LNKKVALYIERRQYFITNFVFFLTSPKMRNKFQQRGFTLIELLVVIVILGILSTISVGTFRSYFAKARDSERVSTAQNIAMMIKVDSGGAGDCTVYNYSDDFITDCDGNDFVSLLTENDYKMPDAKNGLEYFYGFREGEVEGDNDFFIFVLAEEEGAQNGKKMQAVSDQRAFVDGTSEGISIVETTCTLDTTGDTDVPVCTSGAGENPWQIRKISNGAIIATDATVACADYDGDQTACEGVTGCSYSGTTCSGTPT
jgi:prepilin-type N-terminal cleavage/methylation domain-containing protein